jgi:hypothetical protein
MKLIDVLDRLRFADWRRFRIRSLYNRFHKIELITNPSGAGHGMPIAENPHQRSTGLTDQVVR